MTRKKNLKNTQSIAPSLGTWNYLRDVKHEEVCAKLISNLADVKLQVFNAAILLETVFFLQKCHEATFSSSFLLFGMPCLYVHGCSYTLMPIGVDIRSTLRMNFILFYLVYTVGRKSMQNLYL